MTYSDPHPDPLGPLPGNDRSLPLGILCDCVRHAVETYLEDLEGDAPVRLYEMVLAEVERPLLETVLRHTDRNQSQAALCLGMTRATLRKKIRCHGLDVTPPSSGKAP